MGTSYNQPFDRKIAEEFGIGILTGEACAYSMRVLCDVNEDGLNLINRAFGMNITIDGSISEPYAPTMMRRHNSRVNGVLSVASIMLSWTMIEELVKFGIVERHLERGEFVIDATPKENSQVNPFMWGGTQEEYDERFNVDTLFSKHWVCRRYSIFEKQPRRGSMNVHGFTGRAP